MRKFLTILLVAFCGFVASAHADELPTLQTPLTLQPALSLAEVPPSLIERAVGGVQTTLDQALELLGIRYRRGGSSPETGFDCSGYVRHVFSESLGLILPHNAKAISQSGDRVDKTDLLPGDLVFFNTMRHAFSHVGIYLGNDLFVHAPRSGARVRIEDMTDRYWTRRYDGARRVQQ